MLSLDTGEMKKIFSDKENCWQKSGHNWFWKNSSNVAKYATSFNMNIYAYDPFKKIKNRNVTQKKNIRKFKNCRHFNG